MPTPCRLIHKSGERVEVNLRCPHDHHRRVLGTEADWAAGLRAYEASHAATACPQCGEAEEVYAMGRHAVYDTEDGEPHPGDMYWTPCFRKEDGTADCTYWDNCDGQHLHVILPNGRHWDIDSRASNCTLPNDRTHRCWIRTGEPPQVTAGKAGHTCSAGAGSILSGDYHGFLRNGVLT